MKITTLLWCMLITLGTLLAQPHTEHADRDPAMLTEHDKCRSKCHVEHCDSWRACNDSVAAGPALEACHKQVEEDETRCQGGCEAPKT